MNGGRSSKHTCSRTKDFIMSLNPSDYMDGLPVKISEKYKPPPKVSLPQSVHQRLSTEEYPSHPSLDYDFSLERNVIEKIDQWKGVRNLEREQRRERIRKAELERIRILEEKQKQLLTDVSYPNADELSSDDDDDGASNDTKKQETVRNSATAEIRMVQQHPHHSFDSILTPTIVPDRSNQKSLATETSYNSLLKGNYHKINYSDFENDTSSPFDNIELKTINDLDILAQVLNVSHVHSKNESDTQKIFDENKSINLESTENRAETMDSDTTNNANQSFSATQSLQHHLHQQQQMATPIDNQTTAIHQQSNSTYSGTNYQHNQLQHHSTQNANNFYPSLNHRPHQTQHPMISTQNYANINGCLAKNFFYYNNVPSNIVQNSNNYLFNNYQRNAEQITEKYDKNNHFSTVNNHATFNDDMKTTISGVSYANCPDTYSLESTKSVSTNAKNKSKSVPDILKELNDEIRNSEIRRTRNHSQTLDDNEKLCIEESDTAHDASKRNQDNANKVFMKLSPSSQLLAKNISLMGFPLDRVSRIAEKFGNDDKKIVEHLIPLSELLDLGFDEVKISDALFRFDNDKEKALDYLIS